MSDATPFDSSPISIEDATPPHHGRDWSRDRLPGRFASVSIVGRSLASEVGVRAAVDKLHEWLGGDGTVHDGRADALKSAIKSVDALVTTSAALGYSTDYMAALDRVLTCLRAVHENGGPLVSTVDAIAEARQPATVGGLTALHPQCPTHGDTVNCYCTTGALHCHDCGHTPPFCTACDDCHERVDQIVELVALIRTMRIVARLSGGARAVVVGVNGAIAARNLAAAYRPEGVPDVR